MFGRHKKKITVNCTSCPIAPVACQPQPQPEQCVQCCASTQQCTSPSTFAKIAHKVGEVTSYVASKIMNGLRAIREAISPPKNKCPKLDPCEEARRYAMSCTYRKTTTCCQKLI
ncbi:unnamed protein product [Rodentolepis nana]|uniref:Uncharacterized protein n=1 Tax=Rodentolepis nana TaxID=102285 RepID=A0A0R3TCK3_RODNA|nr:unnamed protein product [Rodentolepis nana]